jgi:hypothetical protein
MHSTNESRDPCGGTSPNHAVVKEIFVSEPRSTAGNLGLEVRSIDYVPKNERHGKAWHIGPLWFMRPWPSES